MVVVEEYLAESLPAFDRERYLLTVQLIVAIVFWLFVVPPLVAPLLVPIDIDEKSTKEKPKHGKKSQKSKAPPLEPKVVIPIEVVTLSVILTVGSILWILAKGSSNNAQLPRTVFQAPLLMQQECEDLLNRAHAAAHRNYQMALDTKFLADIQRETVNATTLAVLEEPRGWHKLRYPNYPTVDLNLLADSFTVEDRTFVERKLHTRLSPLISRVYGVPPKALRMLDLQLIRYDGGGAHDRLERHVDMSDISFTLVLNDDFEQGGTRFWDRNTDTPFATATPKTGNVLLYDSHMLHEALSIVGTRYVLQGFVSINNVDTTTGRPTGASWYSTWCSVPWITLRMKDALQRQSGLLENPYIRALVRDLVSILDNWADRLTPHQLIVLVPSDKESAYLAALDDYDGTDDDSLATWIPATTMSPLLFHRNFPDIDVLIESTKTFGVRQEVPMDLTAEKVLNKIRETARYIKTTVPNLSDEFSQGCRNFDAMCSVFATKGGCETSYGYAVTNCPAACQICDMLDYDKRCPPLGEDAVPALRPGSVNRLFERIVQESPVRRSTEAPEYTVKILSQPGEKDVGPWVLQLDNFMTEEECNHLVQLGTTIGYKRSVHFSDHRTDHASEYRTSETAWCGPNCRDSDPAVKIMEDMSSVLGVPVGNSEDIQLLKYEPGAYYKAHHDSNTRMKNTQSGPRILTFFLYLSDMEEGGGTRFSELNITVQPVTGRALLWANVLDNDPLEIDERVAHEALPVIKGRKYAANCWYRLYDFVGPRSRGCVVR